MVGVHAARQIGTLGFVTTDSVKPVSFESAQIDTAESRTVLERYVAELDSRFPAGFDTGLAAPPQPGDFSSPWGVFLLARCNGDLAGCGALRRESDGVAEIRRMWVAPEARGAGVGRALLVELESWARKYGYRAVRLDTAESLYEAKRLYPSAGYEEIAAYNDNPYARHWFEKQLV